MFGACSTSSNFLFSFFLRSFINSASLPSPAARRDLQATVDVISAEKNAFTKESKMWQTRVDKLIEQKNKNEAEENRKLVGFLRLMKTSS